MGGTSLPPLIVLYPAIILCIAMLLPVVYLIIRGLGSGEEAWDLLFRLQTIRTILSTLTLVLTVTLSSLIIAVPLAWLLSQSDLPFKRVWTVCICLPLVIPSFIGAFLITSALGPKGILYQLISAPLNIERLPDIYGLPGATLALTLLSYPYIFLTVRSSLIDLNPSLGESSRTLGHGTISTFFKVILPYLRPSITSGSLLVALYTLSDFGAVSVMRYPTFTWVIYQQYQSAFNQSLAAIFSLILVSIAVVLLVTERLNRGRSRYYQSTGVPRIHTTSSLGRWKIPALVFVITIIMLALILPVGVLSYWVVRGVSEGEPLLLLWTATMNSIFVSTLSAIIAVAFALPVGILLVRYTSLFSKVLEILSYVGYALPGIVVALTLVFFAIAYLLPIYQTVWILLFAYIVLAFPVALGPIRSSLMQLSPNLEDAAHSLGRNTLKTIWSVSAPLMRSGLLMGMALVFLVTMKELPATLILGPLGFKTLATSVWSASTEAFFAQAAAPALTLILVSSVPIGFLLVYERKFSI